MNYKKFNGNIRAEVEYNEYALKWRHPKSPGNRCTKVKQLWLLGRKRKAELAKEKLNCIHYHLYIRYSPCITGKYNSLSLLASNEWKSVELSDSKGIYRPISERETIYKQQCHDSTMSAFRLVLPAGTSEPGKVHIYSTSLRYFFSHESNE